MYFSIAQNETRYQCRIFLEITNVLEFRTLLSKTKPSPKSRIQKRCNALFLEHVTKS